MASGPLWVALALTALATAVRLNGTVDSDVAWQLWIAGRIHAGANLYHDIIETNPPLWFWMALPVDRVASLVHVRIEAVLILFIGTLVALSLTATDRLLGAITPKRRVLLLGYASLTLAAMPWMHVGQREQIVLIGTLPYAALIAARREHKMVAPGLAALVGTGAALGFALKQYFLLVPVLLELWLIARDRGAWRAFRPETLAIVITGIAYLSALMFLEPDYLTEIVPTLRLAYGAFGAPSLRYLFGPFAIIGLLIFTFVVAHWQFLAGSRAGFASALLIAAAGFALAYFIQFKGWPYHAIPLVGCASLALAASLAELRKVPHSMRLLAPALLSMPFVLGVAEVSGESPNPDLLRSVSGLTPGTPVGFIAENSAVPWAVTLQHRLRYVPRYNGFWMLGALQRNELARERDPRLADFARRIVTETVADFRCTPPRRIIVARPKRGSWNENTIDPLTYFMRDPQFAALLSHYRLVSRTTVETYELVTPLPPPTFRCRTGI
jgi:hypothetical protein